MSKYINPPNTQEIIDNLKNAETHTEIVDIIHETFPTWILGWPKNYSSDYPEFTQNWKNVCKKTKSEPLCIIIVDKISFNDPNYSLLQMFAELLTVFGHSVRNKDDFFECKYCCDILPVQSIYNKLKENKIKVPKIWSMKCSGC
jgi:hypothetical protein